MTIEQMQQRVLDSLTEATAEFLPDGRVIILVPDIGWNGPGRHYLVIVEGHMNAFFGLFRNEETEIEVDQSASAVMLSALHVHKPEIS